MPVPLNLPGKQTGRVTLRDVVRTRIKDAILDGSFEPGEVLRDEELQDWLQVSRTPVREALNDLERIGLIEMEPNRYTRVALPSADEILDALQTLGVLLGGAARLAVPAMSDSDRKSASSQIEKSIQGLAADDLEQVNSSTILFFTLLVEKCNNPFLEQLCRDALDGLAYKLRIAATKEIIDFDSLAPLYSAIKDSVLLGDAVEAELAIEALHMLPRDQA